MPKSLRRAFGVLTVLAGAVLFVWSYCPLVLDFLDYTGLANTWNDTCPTKFTSKALFVSGIVVLVIGQRLLSGRKLHTGEKME